MNADMGTARPLTRKERTTAIVGVCSGNLVEWYDFFIYAYTSIYFASLFFIANGDQDIMVPSELSSDMAERIPGSTLVIYEDAGHGGIFQNHADFSAKALAFLAD